MRVAFWIWVGATAMGMAGWALSPDGFVQSLPNAAGKDWGVVAAFMSAIAAAISALVAWKTVGILRRQHDMAFYERRVEVMTKSIALNSEAADLMDAFSDVSLECSDLLERLNQRGIPISKLIEKRLGDVREMESRLYKTSMDRVRPLIKSSKSLRNIEEIDHHWQQLVDLERYLSTGVKRVGAEYRKVRRDLLSLNEKFRRY